jgi:hypothetical protein
MVSNARRHSPGPALLALAVALAVSACSSTFDVLPEKMGGLPASAPERPAERPAFPNVYEVRPTREAKPLNDEEQKKLESELTTLREQQKQLANPPPPTPPPAKKAAAPAKTAAAPARKLPAKTAEPAKKKQNDPIVPEQKGPVAPPKMVN